MTFFETQLTLGNGNERAAVPENLLTQFSTSLVLQFYFNLMY